MRATHPEMPISFEVPEGTGVQEARTFNLGTANRKDGRRDPVRLFGIRPVVPRPGFFHAIEVAFFWITDAIEGTGAEQLDRLSRRISKFDDVRGFLDAVLYARADVLLEDGGMEIVDGLPARRVDVRSTIARGTSNERLASGQVVVVPAPPGAALLVVARFDPESVGWERDELLLHIVHSIAIGENEPREEI